VLGVLALVLLAYGALEALLFFLWAMNGSYASGAVAICVMLGAIGLACLGYAVVLIWRSWRDWRERIGAR
jgi:hypothetical protein